MKQKIIAIKVKGKPFALNGKGTNLPSPLGSVEYMSDAERDDLLKAWEAVRPKLDTRDIKGAVIFGTKGEKPAVQHKK